MYARKSSMPSAKPGGTGATGVAFAASVGRDGFMARPPDGSAPVVTTRARGRRRGGIDVPQAERDAGLVEIVWAHLHFDGVAGGDLDEVLAQLARNVGQHDMAVGQLHAKHRSR